MAGTTTCPLHFRGFHGGSSFELACQIEIFNIPDKVRKFADCGDSGAPVFIFSANQLIAVGMVVAVTSWDTTVVTPIGAILESLQLHSLKNFKIFKQLQAGKGEEAMEEN